MMLDGVISLLVANSGVNTLAAARIYKSVLPRGYTLPAIAIHRSSGTQEYELAGPAGLREDEVQVDCYAADASTAQTLAEAVRSALVGYVGTLPDGTVVQGCFLQRDMDMPFQSHVETKGMAFRSLLGFRFVSVRV